MRIKRLRPERIRKALKIETPEAIYREALRYYQNGKEKLKTVRVEYNRYQDIKSVREACGISYLGILLALDGYFLNKGVLPENLPTTTQGYWAYIKKYLVQNGKLVNAFSNAYENLHVLGYYRGGAGVKMIKEGFQNAKLLIETLGKAIKG